MRGTAPHPLTVEVTPMSHLSTVRRVGVVLALALVLILVALRQDSDTQAVGAAAAPIAGKCAGQQQGLIKGSSTIKGREGTYSITALSHGITSPRDAASGQATGRRQHKPLTFTMGVDRSTPQFIRALTTNEGLTACTFNFWRPAKGAGGQAVEKNYFRVQLGDARVVDYSLSGRPGGADVVTFALTYSKISWNWTDGGITAEDDWETPVAR